MNILNQLVESDNIQSLTNATRLLGEQLKTDSLITPFLLSPQWFAGYLGLKKLIEKDYSQEEEPELLVTVNS